MNTQHKFTEVLATLPPETVLMLMARKDSDGSIKCTYSVHLSDGAAAMRFETLEELIASTLDPEAIKKAALDLRIAEYQKQIDWLKNMKN